MHDLTNTPSNARRDLPFEHLDCFADSHLADNPGAALRMIDKEAERFRRELRGTGMPEYVGSHDLATAPYPTRFGLFRANRTPSPLLNITNRLIVVRWRDRGGDRRTLLYEPTDVELARNVPFYAELDRSAPKMFHGAFYTPHSTVEARLAALGIAPAEVDYLAFDHLHVQDVRRLVGTTRPAPDLSPTEPVRPLFPNARLIVQVDELTALAELHPLQQPWYQPATFRDLRPDALLRIHGDFLLGPGVALIRTPGHATGNQTLVLNTDTGIWAASENVIAAECLTPEHSRIPGVRSAARVWGLEVILNGNTIEGTAAQYNSAVKEKRIVDRSRRDPRFLQFLPTSELTRNRLSPGTAPTFSHGGIWHGRLVREA